MSKAAHDLRESVYEVIKALGIRACLDPQQVEADLAKLTTLATSAGERVASERPPPTDAHHALRRPELQGSETNPYGAA